MCRMIYAHFSSSSKDYIHKDEECEVLLLKNPSHRAMSPLVWEQAIPNPRIVLERITTLRFAALAMPYSVDIRAPYLETGS